MAISNIDALNLGTSVTIAFSEGIRQNLNLDYPEWEMVKMLKASPGGERQLRYLMQTSLGPSSVQYRSPSTSGYEFPAAQQSTQAEATAIYKELTTTIQFEYNLYKRLLQTKSKYDADRLKIEVESKNIATRRQICIDFYGDGSGALGTTSSRTINGDGTVTVTMLNSSTSRGFAGNFNFGERVLSYSTAASATSVTLSTGTFSYFQVVDRDSSAAVNTVTLQAYDTTGTARTTTVFAPSSGDLWYKYGQPTVPNLTSVSDYGTVSEAMAGLASLVSNDGRVVHGLTMSGALGASVYDNDGAALDRNTFEAAMNKVKNAVGQGRYKWSKALMNRYSRSQLIESRETDRRFVTAEDGTLGVAKIRYNHEQDSIELQGAEFCPFNAIYILPEGKIAGHKVLEYHGSDFSAVENDAGVPFFMVPGTNAYKALMHMYLFGCGVLTNNHPASCVKLSNFTIS